MIWSPNSVAAADKEMNRHQCFFLTVCRSPVIAFKRAFDEWTFILSVRCHVAKLHFGTCKLLYFSQCIDKKSPKIAISLSADFILQNLSSWTWTRCRCWKGHIFCRFIWRRLYSSKNITFSLHFNSHIL